MPTSTRYDDIYFSEGGALAQARHVFLAGNGLPERWRGVGQFTILETGFGLCINFLATWQAWLADAERPKRLDFVSIEAQPVSAEDIRRAVLGDEVFKSVELVELAPLAEQLVARYPLALPGLHRIEFAHDDCLLVLTLAIGDVSVMLKELHLAADAVYLDGFSPACNPAMWSPAAMKAIARLMRPQGSAATWTIAADLRKGLREAGFLPKKVTGLPPKRDALRAPYAPAWERPSSWPDNARRTATAAASSPREVIVIGAGLAGACAAHALAKRGWRVTVLDAGIGPASGASGLPAGLMVPHVSPDDAPMSRITRAGAALMREWILQTGLPERHWREAGVLQALDDARRARAPEAWADKPGALFELRDEVSADGAAAGPARFFPRGIAVEAAALVRHLLAAYPGTTTRWSAEAASLAECGADWQVMDANGSILGTAPVVVVATALQSLRIATADAQSSMSAKEFPDDTLRAVRGQMTIGHAALPSSLAPPQPLSGDGHFIAAINPEASWTWLMGASFERGEATAESSAEAHAGNFAKLERLAPRLAEHLRPEFDPAVSDSWVQVRCVSRDRLPLVGELPGRPGVNVLAALGSRGLSLAAICAEMLACQLNHEPWPLESSLAAAISPARFAASPDC